MTWKNYLMELLIVVVGVTIAFWLTHLAENHKEKEQVEHYRSDIYQELQKDSLMLEHIIKRNQEKVVLLSQKLKLIVADREQTQYQEIMPVLMELGNYHFIETQSFTIPSLLQSGDIKLFRTTLLKKEMLRLHWMYEGIEKQQQDLIQGLDKSYFPVLIEVFDMQSQQLKEVNFLYSTKLKNVILFTINDTQRLLKSYQQASKQVNRVLKLAQ